MLPGAIVFVYIYQLLNKYVVIALCVMSPEDGDFHELRYGCNTCKRNDCQIYSLHLGQGY